MSSKSELTKTIESQQTRITRLEQRLGDVVAAYKNLQKEKEALESTVRVLSSKEENQQSTEQTENIDENDQKIQILQKNLTVITEQKNRMEQMFQMDKKKLNTENEELKKALEEAKAENIILREKSDQEIKELKRSNRESQRESERKIAENAVSIRELQTLLSAERNKIETIEHQFDQFRSKNSTLENQFELLKKKNHELNQEIQTKKDENREKDLIDLEELKRAKQTIADLTSKLNFVKNDEREKTNLEEKRRQQLESKINELTIDNAQRVADYETRLTDLSEQIGFIERQKEQDQSTIQRLKERVTQLDIENSLLTKTNSISLDEQENDEIQQISDPEILIQKISQLKNLVVFATKKFGKTFSIQEIFLETNDNSDKIKYQEEIDRLKSELDKYRTKSVTAFKVKTLKETNSSKEVEELRNQVDSLREKLSQSQSLFNNENDRHNEIVEKLQTSLNTIRDQHRQELEQLFNRKRLEINELECELEKQRERTVRLLNEKDRELETTKKQLETVNMPEEPINNELTDLFSQSTVGGPNSSQQNENGKILYFLEEQKLREQEITTLRRQRHEVENQLRDIHRKYSFEISQYQMTIEQLQDELERMKLTERRHQAVKDNEQNIDYIKNVFYHYLLANDNQVKQTMANALMTILHFSSKEKAKVENEKSNRTLSTTGWFSKT